jgi:hypothetical protein
MVIFQKTYRVNRLGRRINNMSRQWKQWIIEPRGVRGGANKRQLINCSLVRDELTGDYMFFGPRPEHPPEATVSSPVEFPFRFPKFTAALNGTTRHDWYIRVDHVHNDQDGGEAHGHWRNTPPPPHDDGVAPTDTDTWTTQAGIGVEPEGDKKKDKKAAASATSK